MITSVQASPNCPLFDTPCSFSSSCTAKTKKIALIFFSALFVLSGAMLCQIETSAAILTAFVSFVIGGILLWKGYKVKDYASPSSLQQFKQTARNAPLQKTINEHKWPNIIRHEIIDPKEFRRIYDESVAPLTTLLLIEFYQKRVVPHVQNSEFNPPHPSEYKDKLKKEWENLTASQIMESYTKSDLHLLYDYGLIPQSTLIGYKVYHEDKQKKEDKLKKIKEDCLERLEKKRTELLKEIPKTTEKNWVWAMKKEMKDLSKLPLENWPTSAYPNKYGIPHNQNHANLTARVKFFQTVAAEKEKFKKMLEKIEQDFQKALARFNQYFKLEKLIAN